MNGVSTPTTMLVTSDLIRRALDARAQGWYNFDTDAGDGSTLWVAASDVIGCEAGDVVEAERVTPAHLAYS